MLKKKVPRTHALRDLKLKAFSALACPFLLRLLRCTPHLPHTSPTEAKLSNGQRYSELGGGMEYGPRLGKLCRNEKVWFFLAKRNVYIQPQRSHTREYAQTWRSHPCRTTPPRRGQRAWPGVSSCCVHCCFHCFESLPWKCV